MSDENTKDLTGNLSDREILLLLRQGLLDLTAEVRDLKGQVGDLRGQVSALNERLDALTERVARLETRTNSLPPNYDARFAALEEDVAVILENQGTEQRRRVHLEARIRKLEAQAA